MIEEWKCVYIRIGIGKITFLPLFRFSLSLNLYFCHFYMNCFLQSNIILLLFVDFTSINSNQTKVYIIFNYLRIMSTSPDTEAKYKIYTHSCIYHNVHSTLYYRNVSVYVRGYVIYNEHTRCNSDKLQHFCRRISFRRRWYYISLRLNSIFFFRSNSACAHKSFIFIFALVRCQKWWKPVICPK